MYNFTQKHKLWVAIALFMGIAPFINAQNFRFHWDKSNKVDEEQVEAEVSAAMEEAIKEMERALQKMEWQQKLQESHWEEQLRAALAQTESQLHFQEKELREKEELLRQLESEFRSEEWSNRWQELAKRYQEMGERYAYHFDFDGNFDFNFDFDRDFDFNFDFGDVEELASREARGWSKGSDFAERMRDFEERMRKEEEEFRRFERELKNQLLEDGFMRYRDDKIELKLKDDELTINGEKLYGLEKRRYERILEKHDFYVEGDANLTIKF